MIPRDVRLPCAAIPALFDAPSPRMNEEMPAATAQLQRALNICRDCPVRAECLAQAEADPPSMQVMGGRIWTLQRNPVGLQAWVMRIREPERERERQRIKRAKRRDEDPIDHALVEQALEGRKHWWELPGVVKQEAVRRLAAAGYTDVAVAGRLKTSPGVVQMWRRRSGIRRRGAA